MLLPSLLKSGDQVYQKVINQLYQKMLLLNLLITQRVFKIRKGSSEIELADPDNSLSPNEVMDFYSMTYPELTTASVHGPECEDDSVVYRFKTTIGTKG